jgi:mycothiol synthase
VVIAAFKNPTKGLGPESHWAAYVNERLAGFGMIEIAVHPDHRRQGIGTELLRRTVSGSAAAGRTVVEAWAITKGGSGDAWAIGRGFRSVHATLMQRLRPDSVPSTQWSVPAPAGYRAISWIGAVPEEYVSSFAHARNAIHDAPFGDIAYVERRWTADLVREHECEEHDSGVELRVVAAVDDAGAIAGFTEIRSRTFLVFSADTATLEKRLAEEHADRQAEAD